MTLNGFKLACAEVVNPSVGGPDVSIADVLILHKRLIELAAHFSFPHRPQIITLRGASYYVMVDNSGLYDSFSLH